MTVPAITIKARNHDLGEVVSSFSDVLFDAGIRNREEITRKTEGEDDFVTVVYYTDAADKLKARLLLQDEHSFDCSEQPEWVDIRVVY